MGQYYRVVSLDKKEGILPSSSGNGLKLMEHSYHYNDFVAEYYDLQQVEFTFKSKPDFNKVGSSTVTIVAEDLSGNKTKKTAEIKIKKKRRFCSKYSAPTE